MIINLICDILCKDYKEPPIYRLWFDNTLLSERKYICKSKKEFIREKCQLNIEPGQHKIRLEPISNHVFTLYKTKVEGRVIAFTDPTTAVFKI
jgi:hypothetical protein